MATWLLTYEARLNYVYMLLLTGLEIYVYRISGLHGVCAGGSMVKIVDLIIGVEYKRTGTRA